MHRYTLGRKCLPYNETTDGIPLHFPDQWPSQTGSKSRRSCCIEAYLEPICTSGCYDVMHMINWKMDIWFSFVLWSVNDTDS